MKRTIWTTLCLLLAALLCGGCWQDEPAKNDSNGITDTFVAGKGIVVYTGYEPLKSKPVNIHYYIPAEGNRTSMPILLVLPGVNRDAGDYLNAWVNIAKDKKVMVFALEFPLGSYSSGEYIEGGMFAGKQLLPVANWTFSMIEPLFDYIVRATESGQRGYDMFGHSAGAQFVHRYMTFVPQNRVQRGVSANAGWYTVPDFGVEYPYGLKNSPATAEGVAMLMGKQLVLQLGTADTDPNSPNLNHTAGSDAQGLYRYARGLYYWQKVQAIAPTGAGWKWQKVETKGVAHDYVKMSAAAAQWLY